MPACASIIAPHVRFKGEVGNALEFNAFPLCPRAAMNSDTKPALPHWTLGEDLDLRTDLSRYRVWRDGVLVGEPREIRDGEQPVFRGGVTAQAAVSEARPPICIPHAPGYPLVRDPHVEDLWRV